MDEEEIEYWKPKYESYMKQAMEYYGYSKEYIDNWIKDVVVNDLHGDASNSSDVELFGIWQHYASNLQPTKPLRMGKGIYISPEDRQQILDFADEIADYYHISTNEVRKNLWSYMKKYILENFANAKEDRNED